jgi:hypothetical protein
MRKAIVFLVSIAMILGSLNLVVAEFFWATKIYGWALFGGATLVALGAYLMWEEFIAPMVGIQAKK